jgi:hypothetical protein
MTVLMFALLAMLLASAPGNPAYASCNAVPDPPPVFFGVRGSIDRPFVSPDSDEVVTLQTAAPAEASSAHTLSSADLLITIFFKPPRETPTPFYIAGNNDCEPLEERACFLERLFCHPRRTCIAGTAVGAAVSVQGGVAQLSFRFPEETGDAGPVAIAVTAAGKPPPSELATRTCRELVASESRPDLTLCIDEFLARPGDDPPGDPTFTALLALPPSYDYQAVCTHSVGGKPNCLGTADDITYTVNSAGDVFMPANWRNILRLKSGGQDLDQRALRASTAVEAVLGQGNRIFIPSPVFLETTNFQGGNFSPVPIFVPQELLDRPNEQTVFGTADKAKSVLKFARRKLWDHSCDAGPSQSQACEPDSASADCPSASCVQSSPAYFACSAGSRLPCTRTAQCPQGACQRVSDTGSVCVGLDGMPTGTTCKQDSDCGANAECGPGLFEFRNRTTNGVGTLKRIATNTRGVCASGLEEGNMCTQSAACSDSAACVTYRAEALLYSTASP